MAAPMESKAAEDDFLARHKCSTLANFVGVTSKTRIKLISHENDILLVRYDVTRPVVFFYVVDIRHGPSDPYLTFQETVNYKHGVRNVVGDGDELHVYTSKGIFISALSNRRNAPRFVSSDSNACCVVGNGPRVLVRSVPGGLEVTQEGGRAPLCCIPNAPSHGSDSDPVLCRVSIREKLSPEERRGLALPEATFYSLFGTVPSPALVLGLRDGRVLSLALVPRARPRLLCRLRQAVVAIAVVSLSDENNSKVPALVAVGREGQVVAMRGTTADTADAPASFGRVSWREDSAEVFHVSHGALWTTHLRSSSGQKATTLVVKSRMAPLTGMVDAQPLPSGTLVALTEAGRLLLCSSGEGACDPAALVQSVANTARNLHRARLLLSKRQAHLQALRLGTTPVTVTASRTGVPGAPVAVKFQHVPRECGWQCCVTLRSDGGRVTCRCVPSRREEDGVTLWLEEPPGYYLEVRPWLLLAPGAPLAVPRIPLATRHRRSVAGLAPAFTVASSTVCLVTGSAQGLLPWLNEAVPIERSSGAVSVELRDSHLVSVGLDCGNYRAFVALRCAVARCLLIRYQRESSLSSSTIPDTRSGRSDLHSQEALRRSEVPDALHFKVLPGCAAAVQMLQLREGDVLDTYRRWRRVLANLVLA